MIETGVDAFVVRWRKRAAEAVLFGRPEGSPLLEIDCGGAIVQLLERTHPYASVPGRTKVIVNPTAATLEPAAADAIPSLDVPSMGALAGTGAVVEIDDHVLVLDVGVPIVLACEDAAHTQRWSVGDLVRFESKPPVHGFVVQEHRTAEVPGKGHVDDRP